ncbi:MAG: hypothetical protein GAK29_04624 [Acinetobacter bereziniae]|uniref:Uncharacterized protein n=1 Tax=Acinetobacter bereziniae TaxID=106648 RepID=A0A833UQW7_ACIBZ|nr:MAG: hypothetical protein GAK29_04624 [Acinetobacter bereziniae]
MLYPLENNKILIKSNLYFEVILTRKNNSFAIKRRMEVLLAIKTILFEQNVH